MIWILGGTSEARELIDRVKDLDNYIVTIATEGGKEFIDGDNVIVGRMNYESMIKLCKENQINIIIDLTHPYAKIVSKNVKQVAEELEIRYIRYIREKVKLNKDIIYLNSYEEAYRYLKKISGTIFFTTGSKNIKDFENVRGNNRHVYRVLPAGESIEECKRYNIQMKDIVAVLGPFSKDYNKVMLKEYKADFCIMKDSGDRGGTLEKIQACMELNIEPIIIGREWEEGYVSLDQIEGIIRNSK